MMMMMMTEGEDLKGPTESSPWRRIRHQTHKCSISLHLEGREHHLYWKGGIEP